jgi:hypothetical protein
VRENLPPISGQPTDEECVEWLFARIDQLESEALAKAKRARTPTARPEGHPLTPNEAAAYLGGISVKTLRRHPIPFIIVGKGRVKARRMYAVADLAHFIESQRQHEAKPCQSTSATTRRISISTSKCAVFDFTALQAARTDAKRKR